MPEPAETDEHDPGSAPVQIIALVKETARRISRSIGNHREMP